MLSRPFAQTINELPKRTIDTNNRIKDSLREWTGLVAGAVHFREIKAYEPGSHCYREFEPVKNFLYSLFAIQLTPERHRIVRPHSCAIASWP